MTGSARPPSRQDLDGGSSFHGVVRETGGGVYLVAREDGSTVEASLRGRLKQEQRAGGVVIGDRVEVDRSGDAWVIESVEPRATTLVRRGRGGRAPKVLVANLDRIFVVVALRDPPASTQLVDRLLALVESSGMHPILVLNKVDLPGAKEEAERLGPLYRGVGYEVLEASAERGDGIEALRTRLCSGSSALIGPSGVGKSSLLNAIAPELDLRIGALSRKTGTGRHTTVGSRMIALDCGGLVADTPGFGDVGLWAIDPSEVATCFPEFLEPSERCRFRGCAHRQEPGCGVREAVEEGRIPRSRWESYGTLRDEAEAASAR